MDIPNDLKLTPERIAELLRMAPLLLTQDPDYTAFPVYEVQRRRRIYGIDSGYAEEFAWIDCEHDCEEATAEESAELEKKWKALEDIDPRWTRIGYRDEWETLDQYLTREAALRRMAKAAGIGNARLYTNSAYRNHEMQAVRALVAAYPNLIAAQPQWVLTSHRMPPPGLEVVVANDTRKAATLWRQNADGGWSCAALSGEHRPREYFTQWLDVGQPPEREQQANEP